MRRWVRHPLVRDVALALLVLEMEWNYRSGEGPATPGVVLVAIIGAALVFIRRRPVLTAVLAGALFVVSPWMSPGDRPVSVMIIALYGVGRHTPLPVAFAALLCVALGDLVVLPSLPESGWSGSGLVVVLSAAAPLTAGYVMRLRRELAERREAEAERVRWQAEEDAARERREIAAEAVRLERRRIARELHDVVAHHVSVINLYMGVARRTIPSDPARAQETLLTGEDTARRAMAEMRQMLDVLRTDGEPAESQAGVGVEGLPALVEESGNAAIEVTGEVAGLATTVDHAVYRIVQEALTNTRKHAGGAASRVRLAYLPGMIELEVLDEGRTRPEAGDGGLGLGLAGMAERVALCGGELRAGPGPEGGFRVFARIPTEEAS
ncbi:sensor histidine kinase [Rhizohabitans arisaemae]|uniref:sensor histidine kinase n=1 Tax=Rhizohabitans arisaemae TaxID=2720610 RepID=UPI0024B09FB5|nr:histidine kinase [Rhizohabitans arisaemae]